MYQIGNSQFVADGKRLRLELNDSQSLLGDPAALRDRLFEDGYLFLRSVHDREEVLAARRSILERLSKRGEIAADAPLMDGVIATDIDKQSTSSVRGNEDLKNDLLRQVVYGTRILRFFEQLLGGPIVGLQFQWLRAAGTGARSAIHCDAPFMSRGSQRLLTCWTPLGDLTPEMGPLAICLGSHRWRSVVETYGQSDVDRDLTNGAFTEDANELVDTFGGQWATADFRAGDVVIFGMHLLHASLTNQTDRFRISVDTRYQPAEDRVDERWAGDCPRGHDRFWEPGVNLEPIAVSRAKWGV